MNYFLIFTNPHPPKIALSLARQSLRTLLVFLFLLVVQPASLIATDSPVREASPIQVEAVKILEARCIRCHGTDQSESNLRLDRNDLMKKNGSAGNPILGMENESELIRRISSNDPTYRMPKDESPLPESEIELLRQWIRTGEGLPHSDTSHETAVNPQLTFWERHSSTIDKIEAFDKPIRVLYVPALIFLLIAFWSERRKRTLARTTLENHQRSFADRFLIRLRWHHYLVVAVGFTMFGRLLQNREKIDQIETQLQLVQRENKELKEYDSVNKKEGQVVVYRPKHPPRLGGMYYRGNDERNPELFNGGYYRTASMEVGLFDSNDQQLQWGDKASSNELYIRLDIQRAPFATPELFHDDTMEQCILTPRADSDEESILQKAKGVAPSLNPSIAKLVTIEPSKHWRARYRIAASTENLDESYSGMLYLTPGSPPPHYGIEYRVKIKDGVISDESEIWMGTSYLTATVVVPRKDTIPLSEWFDFLPIPEIAGGNTHDPKLLGIEPK